MQAVHLDARRGAHAAAQPRIGLVERDDRVEVARRRKRGEVGPRHHADVGDTRLELAIRHGVDPHEHCRADLDPRAIGLVEAAGHLNRGQIRQLGDRRAEEHPVAPLELRRRRNHRAAGAEVRQQRDRSRRRGAQRQRLECPLGFGNVVLRLVALLPGDRDVGGSDDALALDLLLDRRQPAVPRWRAAARAFPPRPAE